MSVDPSEGQDPTATAVVEPDQVDQADQAPGPSIVAAAKDGEDSVPVEPPVAPARAKAKPRAAAAGTCCGAIRHKPTSNDMFVKCGFHADCTKTRTCNPPTSEKRRAQGRVLGFLSGWCLDGGQFDSKVEHFKYIPSLELRKTSRARLKEEVNSRSFFDLERAKLDGEESEPEKCP